jgi:hypothetical protein
MALVMVLTLLALLGLAIAGALASTVASQRAAKLSQDATALDAAADRAAAMVLADANAYGLASLRLGESRVFDMEMLDAPETSASAAVTRLAGGVLWIVATAWLRLDPGAARRVNLVARFPSVGLPPPAPIVTRGSISLGDGVQVSADTAGEADCALDAGAAAIVPPGATIDAPERLHVDTAASARDSATYYLTERQLALLRAAAGVIHVTGDTIIDGGALDGILLIDGSLTIRGTFVASGLIVVRGGVDASEPTFTLRGALLSYASPPHVSTILTAASIEFAPCVVARALRVALPPRAVRLRHWSELF